MKQYLRSNGLPTSATITKVLANPTPNLPSGVTGLLRLKGLPSASMMLKIFQTSYFLTNESGDHVTDEGGNYFEMLI